MKIIDKASWQIDGGIQKSAVKKHFETVFCWLDCKNMLTPDGKEEFDFGFDESSSINEQLISLEALAFLESRYDEYLKSVEYGVDSGAIVLERIYYDYVNVK